MRNVRCRSASPLLAIAGALLLWTLLSNPVAAGGPVGTGTPGSCTEAALDARLSGGGIVTFNCGAAPTTIFITTYKQIFDNTEVRGGNKITLSGANNTPHFQVVSGKQLSLSGIILTQGKGNFGAIENFGRLVMTDTQILNSSALFLGGAISNQGDLQLTRTTLAFNQSDFDGGAIYSAGGGRVTIHSSTIFSNTAIAGRGGGIYSEDPTDISGSRIERNQAPTLLFGWGGGIFSSGPLTVTASSLIDNRSNYPGGGGVYATARLVMNDVLFQDNATLPGSTIEEGGGLFTEPSATASLSRVAFVGNTSNYAGGGVLNLGVMSITDATFSHNYALRGGALANLTSGVLTLTRAVIYTNTGVYAAAVTSGDSSGGATTLINVTISDNTSLDSDGAAVRIQSGVLRLIYTTIVGNHGGMAGVRQLGAGQLLAQNSVVANNTPQNCQGAIISNGHNVSSDGFCFFSQTGDHNNTNPLLGPLANNGGNTLTHLPLTGSPLIDLAPCVAEAPTDQRNRPRPYGPRCDSGAVEVWPFLEMLPVVVR